VHVVDAKCAEHAPGALGQRLDDFNRVDLRAEMREHRRLITRARADLQDLVRGPNVQSLRHERHDVRL
jgi:hypothetical protein